MAITYVTKTQCEEFRIIQNNILERISEKTGVSLGSLRHQIAKNAKIRSDAGVYDIKVPPKKR